LFYFLPFFRFYAAFGKIYDLTFSIFVKEKSAFEYSRLKIDSFYIYPSGSGDINIMSFSCCGKSAVKNTFHNLTATLPAICLNKRKRALIGRSRSLSKFVCTMIIS